MNSRFLTPLTILILLISSCKDPKEIKNEPVSNYDYRIIHEWNQLFLKIDKDALNFRPIPASRALAYINWATYEACVPGMDGFNSLKNELPFIGANIPDLDESVELYWPEVVNVVQAFMMSRMFEKVEFFISTKDRHFTNASAKESINNLKENNEIQFLKEVNESVLNNSKIWAEKVAQAVWDWSKSDKAGHEYYLDPYNQNPFHGEVFNWEKFSKDTNGNLIPGAWRPTDDNIIQEPLFPLAGKMRKFATNNLQTIGRKPNPYSKYDTTLHYNQNAEVLVQSSIPSERKHAIFWSDDLVGITFSAASRIISCLDQILEEQNSKLDQAIFANAILSIALNDLGIVCWNSKYYYNLESPESYIQNIINEKSYQPALNHPINETKGISPAYPSYPSEHSTFAGGCFMILASLFGDIELIDSSHVNNKWIDGSPERFILSRAAYLISSSRIPLGVNLRQDCEEGVRLGQEISARILKLPWKN